MYSRGAERSPTGHIWWFIVQVSVLFFIKHILHDIKILITVRFYIDIAINKEAAQYF